MKCHKLNDSKFLTRWWHRLSCPDCREAQHLDTMIGFGLMQMKSEPLGTQGLENTLSALNLPQVGRNARLASRRLAGRWLRRQTRNAGVALITGGVWWQYMNYIPPINIPARIAPQQNAFDFFKQAGKMVAANKELTNEVEEARQKPGDPPTRERRDARLKREGKPLLSISQLMQMAERENLPITFEGKTPANSDGQKHFDNLVPGYVYAGQKIRMPYTRAEKQRLLDDNQQALAVLREGLKYPYMDLYKRRFDAMFPYYSDFRQAARLLSLEANVQAQRGDWNGAMQSSLDAMQLGEKIAHGGPMIGRLVGIACASIGQQEAWKAVEHLNSRQAKAAIARLQTIRADHAPFADTMQEEEWFMQESLRAQMQKPGWRASFAQLSGSNEPRSFELATIGWSNRIILKDITDVMDESARRSRLPYAQSHKLPEIKEPFDPIVMIMFPIFSQAQFRDVYASETQSALLVTALALRAYSFDHSPTSPIEGSTLPESLTQLVPGYLREVPADPFSPDGAPLMYYWHPPTDTERQERANSPLGPVSYVLYSVGPDGKNDSGSPIDALKKPNANSRPATYLDPDKKNRFMVQPDSQGDILAGVNTQ